MIGSLHAADRTGDFDRAFEPYRVRPNSTDKNIVYFQPRASRACDHRTDGADNRNL